jgi:mRNA-degrading endonuclease toxin of MazEF toxin-antitoxin module
MADDPPSHDAGAKPASLVPPPTQPTLGRAGSRIVDLERGMIFWAEVTSKGAVGSEQLKTRPWLVVSRNKLRRLGLAIAVPLSTKLAKGESTDFRGFRIRIPETEIEKYSLAAGVPQMQAGDSLVLTEQVRVMDHARFPGNPIARVTVAAMAAVEAGLRQREAEPSR